METIILGGLAALNPILPAEVIRSLSVLLVPRLNVLAAGELIEVPVPIEASVTFSDVTVPMP